MLTTGLHSFNHHPFGPVDPGADLGWCQLEAGRESGHRPGLVVIEPVPTYEEISF